MGSASSASGSPWNLTYTDIKAKHDQAFGIIQEAITLEESNRNAEALEKYKDGIRLIDQTLRIQVTCPEHPDITWEKACVMIQKMKKTRGEILSRINALQAPVSPPNTPLEQPPSYEEAMACESTPRTYTDLAQALNQLRLDSSVEMEAETIYLYEGVKIYFISPSGEVSSPLHSQTLKIVLVENEGANIPRAILQVGDWIYPLIPGVSPCYRTTFGAYVIPNVYADIPGSSIGIILPPDADESAYDLLESILYGIVGQAKPPKQPVAAPEPEISDRISSGIIAGAGLLSRGLVFGAGKLGELINQKTSASIDRMEGSQEDKEIPAKVAKTIQVAETATCKAAKVTGYLAEQVGLATMKLGRYLAPHIEKQGTRLLTSGLGMSEANASAKMKGVMTVAAGAVEGFSTIYTGLEDSASILGESLKNNTVKVVQHKYGHTAGDVAADTLNTVGNVYTIGKNTKIIRPKHLVRKTAKEAGKAMAVEYRNRSELMASTSGLNQNSSLQCVEKEKAQTIEKQG